MFTKDKPRQTMATLVLEFASDSVDSTSTTPFTKTYEIKYTPPANISGKLCRLYVEDFLAYIPPTNTSGTEALYKLEASFTQPYGTYMKYSSGSDAEPQRNRLIATNYPNFTYTCSGKPITVQLEDGPQMVTFKLSSANGLSIKNDAGKTPYIVLILHIAPIDRNQHFEKLESYSTGPFIRF